MTANGERRQSNADRNSGTFLALAALMLVGAGLLMLVAIVLPQALGLVLVVFGFFLMGLLHYVTWGWWLSRTPADEDEDTE
jgi:Flp pilus assembly protein TadB